MFPFQTLHCTRPKTVFLLNVEDRMARACLGQAALLGALADLGDVCLQQAALFFTMLLVLRPRIALPCSHQAPCHVSRDAHTQGYTAPAKPE